MVIKTDTAPPEALLNRLRARPNILRVKSLELPRGGHKREGVTSRRKVARIWDVACGDSTNRFFD